MITRTNLVTRTFGVKRGMFVITGKSPIVLGDGVHLVDGFFSRIPSPGGFSLSGENSTARLCAVQYPLMAVLCYFFGEGQQWEDEGADIGLNAKRTNTD